MTRLKRRGAGKFAGKRHATAARPSFAQLQPRFVRTKRAERARKDFAGRMQAIQEIVGLDEIVSKGRERQSATELVVDSRRNGEVRHRRTIFKQKSERPGRKATPRNGALSSEFS